MPSKQIESLESRRLMSVSMSLSFDRVLTLRGTTGNDNIQIYQVADIGNGQPGFVVPGSDSAPSPNRSALARLNTVRLPDSIPAREVTRIVVLAGSGDDTVDLNLATLTVDGASAVSIPVKVDGGRGNDTLYGGSAADVLIGGAGSDKLIGNGGIDRITGGAGADIFSSGDASNERRDFNARRGDTLLAETASDSEGELLSTVPQPTYLQTIAVEDKFTFRGPPDLTGGPLQGLDSLVGRYENANFELSYDYGWYSGTAPVDGYRLTSITVDGKPATLATKGDTVGVFIPNVEGMNALSVVVRLKNNAASASATALFSTIEFPA